MDFLREWFLAICGAAMLGVFATAVTPSGSVKKAVQIAASLILVITVLSPFAGGGELPEISLEDFSVGEAEFSENSINEILSSIIAGQTRAYIVSKAQALGLVVEVYVECAVLDFFPEPWAVTVVSERPEHARSALRRILEQDLNIPPERQMFIEPNYEVLGED